jgi:hypothetical protein
VVPTGRSAAGRTTPKTPSPARAQQRRPPLRHVNRPRSHHRRHGPLAPGDPTPAPERFALDAARNGCVAHASGGDR